MSLLVLKIFWHQYVEICQTKWNSLKKSVIYCQSGSNKWWLWILSKRTIVYRDSSDTTSIFIEQTFRAFQQYIIHIVLPWGGVTPISRLVLRICHSTICIVIPLNLMPYSPNALPHLEPISSGVVLLTWTNAGSGWWLIRTYSYVLAPPHTCHI